MASKFLPNIVFGGKAKGRLSPPQHTFTFIVLAVQNLRANANIFMTLRIIILKQNL